MKQVLAFVCALMLMLTGCGGGNASQVQVIIGESEIYTQREIEMAMEVAMNYFRREFDGCTMTKIQYDEAKSKAAATEAARLYNSDEAIILYCSFDVDSSGGDGSLNPNSTYNHWQWILTRNGDGKWVLRTWGYG